LPPILLVLLPVWMVVDFAEAGEASQPVTDLSSWSNGLDALQRLFAWILSEAGPTTAKTSAMLPAVAAKAAVLPDPADRWRVLCGRRRVIVGLPALRLRGDYLRSRRRPVGDHPHRDFKTHSLWRGAGPDADPPNTRISCGCTRG